MHSSFPDLSLHQAYFSYRHDDAGTEAASADIHEREHSNSRAVDPPPQPRLKLGSDLKQSLGDLADRLGHRNDAGNTGRAEDRVLVCREVQKACGENSVRLAIMRDDVSVVFDLSSYAGLD